ncbi:MAG: hypothetical protein JXB60_04110, partial [Candidatus Cloacimonetes bacterium]|nr:hypothetical protein [Candidatus Cloacimonadota bacterium]
MKKQLLLIVSLLFFISSVCFSYTWENVGPDGYECNNFVLWGGGCYHEIICTTAGILVNMGNNIWDEYTYANLPCWDAEQVYMATADLIVAMGNGSYSDGIYFFNFITFEFFICEWFLNPRFIYYCWNDEHFYTGGEQGLMKAEVPSIWASVDFFNGKFCYDMVTYYDNYIVATSDGVFYSDDAGQNWYPASTNLYITDLEIDQDELILGIFPDTSWSSGLWTSDDYGENWEVEFWDALLSSVSCDEQNLFFVGWEEPNGVNQGVALYTRATGDLTPMNEGLPNTCVNRLTYHPFLIYPNIVCCTDNGTYMLSGYSGTAIDPPVISEHTAEMKNYPNPFNPLTTITYSLPRDTMVILKIFDVRGQLV